jgi:hypothetical protein
MTLREAIERFDRLYPNALEPAAKRGILSEFDGRLYSEVLVHYEGAPTVFSGYTEHTDPDTVLLAAYPYDDVYLRLLCAENDLICGDIERYNNAAALFNAAFDRYTDYINRTRRRKPGARIRY